MLTRDLTEREKVEYVENCKFLLDSNEQQNSVNIRFKYL